MSLTRFTCVVAAAGMACSSLASARLGESKAECAARYGEPTGTVPAKLAKSEPEADVFSFNEIKIVVEYRAGEAWMVSYAASKLNQTNADKILASYSEATGATWEGPGKFAGTKHWTDTKGSRHAVLYESPLYKLVLFDKTAIDAKYNPVVFLSEQEEEPVEEPEAGEDDPKPRPRPTKKDPFDGL